MEARALCMLSKHSTQESLTIGQQEPWVGNQVKEDQRRQSTTQTILQGQQMTLHIFFFWQFRLGRSQGEITHMYTFSVGRR